jgi:hypothetical protein
VTLQHDPLSIATIAGFLLIIGGSWLSTTGSIPWLKARKTPELETRAGD